MSFFIDDDEREREADVLDRAVIAEETALEDALKRVAGAKHMKPCGICFNCDQAIFNEGCFCDVDCRDDYQARERRIQDSGFGIQPNGKQ